MNAGLLVPEWPQVADTPHMHGEVLRLLTAIGMPAPQHCDSFCFRRAAFYNGLKSKVQVGLTAAKAAALNIDGCGVAPPVHASSRAPLLLANLLAHNLPTPRVH